jgi:uncharacterized protein YjbJ (UPF0337 family)
MAMDKHQRMNGSNKLTFNGTWNEMQGKLKKKHGRLTDKEHVCTEAKRE